MYRYVPYISFLSETFFVGVASLRIGDPVQPLAVKLDQPNRLVTPQKNMVVYSKGRHLVECPNRRGFRKYSLYSDLRSTFFPIQQVSLMSLVKPLEKNGKDNNKMGEGLYTSSLKLRDFCLKTIRLS